MTHKGHKNEDSDASESDGRTTPNHIEMEEAGKSDRHSHHNGHHKKNMEEEEEQKLPAGTEKRSMINSILVGLAFFFVFFASSGTNSLLSSILPGDLGYWSLGCIYLGFTIGSLLLSTIAVTVLTPKWAMFIGSFFYCT